jgi:hypothetical protein
MRVDQAGLFDLPDPVTPDPDPTPQRGRNGEAWSVTATAEVVITDAGALLRAAADQSEGVVLVDPSEEPAWADSPHETTNETTNEATVDDPFDALAWLIWPTEGLESLLEVGALRILSADSETVAQSSDRGTATWRVTVKLTDVGRLRRLAAGARPDESAEISASLAVAWQHAADPFAPLHVIDGIDWEPGPVIIEHLPARAADSRS